jgi:hypothetical protein
MSPSNSLPGLGCPVMVSRAVTVSGVSSVASDITDHDVRKILLAMNPVIEYPGSSQIQRARRLRYHVETRGWEQTEKLYPEVGRMRAELIAGLEAGLAGRTVVELPEPDGVDDHGPTWSLPGVGVAVSLAVVDGQAFVSALGPADPVDFAEWYALRVLAAVREVRSLAAGSLTHKPVALEPVEHEGHDDEFADCPHQVCRDARAVADRWNGGAS